MGSQRAKKFNSEIEDDIVIFLAVWRVNIHAADGSGKKRETDVVASVNVNRGSDGEEEVEKVKGWFERTVKNMKIVDYGLFVEVEEGKLPIEVISPPSPIKEKSKPAAPAAWTIPGKISNEQMSRLLLDGLSDNDRVAKARIATVPRGLINTGNMCFANSILQVLAYCAPLTALFEELGKRLQADLGRRTPLIEAMCLFLKEFAPVDTAVASESKGAGSQLNMRNGTMSPLSRKEPFVPSYVYDAMRENKRFDSMRVSGHICFLLLPPAPLHHSVLRWNMR